MIDGFVCLKPAAGSGVSCQGLEHTELTKVCGHWARLVHQLNGLLLQEQAGHAYPKTALPGFLQLVCQQLHQLHRLPGPSCISRDAEATDADHGCHKLRRGSCQAGSQAATDMLLSLSRSSVPVSRGSSPPVQDKVAKDALQSKATWLHNFEQVSSTSSCRVLRLFRLRALLCKIEVLQRWILLAHIATQAEASRLEALQPKIC